MNSTSTSSSPYKSIEFIRINGGKIHVTNLLRPEKLEIDANVKQPSSIVGKLDELKQFDDSFLPLLQIDILIDHINDNRPNSAELMLDDSLELVEGTYQAPAGLLMKVDNDHDVISSFDLLTRVWTFDEKLTSYGCAECCNGDRCEEDCVAQYKRSEKNCPHCNGSGWIHKTDQTSIVMKKGQFATIVKATIPSLCNTSVSKAG